jgi:hypothetical protein
MLQTIIQLYSEMQYKQSNPNNYLSIQKLIFYTTNGKTIPGTRIVSTQDFIVGVNGTVPG